MQRIAPEAVEHPYISTWKVHRLSCMELKKIVDKITEKFMAIDSARPRCNPGVKALCLLHRSMEKCTLLLRHCSESSKLYLAISGERIILRCERIQYSLGSCLSQLKNMVEPTLAAQISQIIDYISTVTFTLDSLEDEAGKVLLALLHCYITASRSTNLDEIKAFKFAASRLQITSPNAVSIEKRSIKKQLSIIGDTDLPKKKILNYFLYLMSKYGKTIQEQTTERSSNASSGEPEGDDDVFDSFKLPVKFKSNRLNKVSSFLSESSFSSSLGDLCLQLDNVSFRSSDTNSLDYVREVEIEYGSGRIQEKFEKFKCSPGTNNGTNLFILVKLSVLPWESRRKVVEDVKNKLKDDEGCCSLSTSYIYPVIKFLKEAHRRGDLAAKRHGAELLLMFLKECRTDVPPLPKDSTELKDFFLFLNSEITEETLSILETLSRQHHYTSEIVAYGSLSLILQILKNPNNKHQNLTLRILCNLSTHTNLAHHLIYLECIQNLVPFLDELLLSSHCLKILKNLCTIEESTAHFVENENCIVSIGELLEVGKDEEQEHALDILLDLCYRREEVREVLMQNSILLSLVNISQNGSSRGKLVSSELLQLLNNVTDDCSQELSVIDVCESSSGDSRTKNSCSKSSGLFGKIKSRLRKTVGFFSGKD